MPTIGTQQSPIKIESTKAIHVSFGTQFLKFHYARALTGKIDEKENFAFDPPADPKKADDWTVTVGGVPWLIRQIHMHAAAEHLIDSDTAKPFEVHLVHSAPTDEKAAFDKLVVGVFITPGKETREKRSLERFADRLSKRGAAYADEPHEVNPADFLPDCGMDRFFRYEGSLTGCPYSEDVSWFVMKEDGVVDRPKFDALENHARHTARPTQPSNRRFVLKSFA